MTRCLKSAVAVVLEWFIITDFIMVDFVTDVPLADHSGTVAIADLGPGPDPL